MGLFPTGSSRFAAVLGLWFGVAVIGGATGAMAALRPPMPQAILGGLTAAVMIAYARWASFRQWVLALDIRALIALHITRFVGFYFLLLNSVGRLPFAFAVPGGCGDIAVAFLALAVVGLGKQLGKKASAVYFGWNVMGLLDILFVVATAARLGMSNPGSMHELTHLPLSLLPTFLVPLIISTHLIIFARLVKEEMK